MNKDQYKKRYPQLIKNLKEILEKGRFLEIKESEESRISELNTLYEYIQNDLGMKISTLPLNIESVWEHDCISNEEKEKLDALYLELLEHRENQTYLIKSRKLVKRIKKVIEKCRCLEVQEGEENRNFIIKEIYEYIRKELEMNISIFYSKVELIYKHKYISKEEKEMVNTIFLDLTECQRNTTYLRNNNELVKQIKQVIEKFRTLESKEGEESDILEIKDIYEYIRKELEMHISVFYSKVKVVYDHKGISKKENEELDALYPKLIAHQEKLVYLRQKSKLINSIQDIIEKSKILKINELYKYIEEKGLTPSQLKSTVQSVYEHNCISKSEKNQFDKKYEELVSYHDSIKEIRKEERYNKRYIEMIDKLVELSKQEKLSSAELNEYIKEKFNCKISALELKIKTASKYNALTEKQVKSLTSICQRVTTYRKNNRKAPVYEASTKKIKTATIMIEEFIESGKSLSEYHQESGISSYQHNEYLRFISKYNPTLYERYINYLEWRKEYIEEIVSNTRNDILDKIENGIVLEDNSIKEFDVIDYYLLTNTPLDEYAKAFKKKTNNLYEIRTFFHFYDKSFDQKLPLKQIKGILDCINLN